MDIGVDITAHDGHRLSSGRSDPDELDVKSVPQPPQHRGRTVGAGRNADRTRPGHRRCCHGVAAVHLTDSRQSDRGVGDHALGAAGALPQCHVHRPVVAVRQRVLPGAVQRIDDPHPIGLQALEIVVRLLGQHGITGSLSPQPLQQHRISPDVAGVTQLVRKVVADLFAHRQQKPPGLLGQFGGQLGVGQTHPASIPEWCASTIRALPR